MNAIDGYQRAALTLRALDPREQEWLLSQLDDNDQQRLAALMGGVEQAGERQEERVEKQQRQDERESEEVAAVAVPAPPPESPHPDVRFLESVSRATLSIVLKEQPQWVLALVLAYWRRNLALAQYVARLGESRCKRIYGLVESVQNAIKPKVRDAVLRSLAADAERHENMPERTPDFEGMLIKFGGR
ncbi:MAG TPA: hypothetical protein VGA88_13010 [Burkholderiales bacterium]